MNATKQTVEKLLTAQAVAEMLSLSKRQIFRLNACGRIPAPVRISGAVRWKLEEDIKPWIAMGCPDRRTFEVKQEAERC